AADAGVARRHHLDAPPVALGELAVHAEQLGGEERRFVATRPGADLEDDVLLVVRILGDEHHLEIRDDRVTSRGERLRFFLGELAHVGVARRGELLGFREALDGRFVLAEALGERLEIGERLGVLAVFGLVVLHFGRAEQPHQLFVALFLRRQFIEHYSIRAGPHPRPLTPARRGDRAYPEQDVTDSTPSFYPPETGGRNATSSPS